MVRSTSPVAADFLEWLAEPVAAHGAVEAAADQAVVLALVVPALVAMAVLVMVAVKAVVPA